MEQVAILFVSPDAALTGVMQRVISGRAGWTCVVAGQASELPLLCADHYFDLVLLGAGLGAAEEAAVYEWLRQLAPGVPVVQHYGGGSGLLYSTVRHYLGF